jgi:hypothetical protein
VDRLRTDGRTTEHPPTPEARVDGAGVVYDLVEPLTLFDG